VDVSIEVSLNSSAVRDMPEAIELLLNPGAIVAIFSLQFNTPSARSVFLAINPIEGDELSQQNDDLTKILQDMGYVPLAITLIAHSGISYPCQYLLQQWKHARKVLLQSQGTASDKLSSVDVSIEVSLNSSAMRNVPEAIELLAIICYLPDGLLMWREKLPAITAGFHNIHEAVHVLLKTSLVDTDGDSLKVLSPI
jgi:hypothetical protein